MRQYETGFVLSPALSEEEITQFLQQMTEIVAQKKGRMVKQDIWGKRRLAFPIKRFQEGFYVFLTYDGGGDVSTELERRFKQSDAVVEHEPPLFQRRFFLYAAVGVAAVILIIALIQYLILAPMRAPAEGLEARVSMPDLVTTSTPSPIEVTVTNQDAGRALGFRVEFPAETLQRFTIVGSTPKAVTMEEHRGAQRLAFEPVPPMQYARVTIRIQGKRAGSKDFEMLVADERGRLITRHSQHKLDVEP